MAKESLYLVMKSKSYYGNVLGYNIKTGEYVFLHFNKEVWREKAPRDLFDYMNEYRANPSGNCDVEKYAIYQKYAKSCEEIM